MHFNQFAAAVATACATLALAGPANAAVLLTTGGSTANTITDYRGQGAVSFDLDLENFNAATLRFSLEEEDLLGPLSLNAIVRNLSGTAMNQFHFRLNGISFAAPGSVTPTFGTLGELKHGENHAGIGFASPEWAEFHFGNPLGLHGASNWLLDTRGLNVGDTFVISAEVPEPSTLALLLPTLCMAGLMATRRRKKG
jgi:hypothetical protein